MSKVIITLTDEGDEININVAFDPALDNRQGGSAAQWLADRMLQLAAELLCDDADGSAA